MGFIDTSISLQNTTLVTTAETLILASVLPLPVGASVLNLPGGSGLNIFIAMQILGGTTVTSYIIRVRRGFGTSGAIDGELQNIPAVAGGRTNFGYMLGVQPAWLLEASGGQYSVTLQQVGATGNATVDYAGAFYWILQ